MGGYGTGLWGVRVPYCTGTLGPCMHYHVRATGFAAHRINRMIRQQVKECQTAPRSEAVGKEGQRGIRWARGGGDGETHAITTYRH